MTIQQLLDSVSLIGSYAMTGSTLAMSSPGLGVGVLLGVLMISRAVGLASLNRGSVPTGSNRILSILSWSAPIEVCQNVVDGVVVSVATPQALRSWTFKNGKHKSVHSYHLPFPPAKERNGVVPTARLAASNKTLRKNLALQLLRKPASTNNSAIHGSHTAMVRDFVTRMIRNRSPLFVSHDASVTLSFCNRLGDNT